MTLPNKTPENAAWEMGMRDARDLAHEILKDECCFHEVLGWSHGWRCEAIRNAILATIISGIADRLEKTHG